MTEARTIPELLDRGAARFGEHPAVVDGERTLSYAALSGRARDTARAYLAAGVRPGDRVALWAPNTVDFIVALLGAQVMGAAVVPLNTRYRGHEARVVLERSKAAALVVANGFLGTEHIDLLVDSAAAGSPGASDPVPGLPHLHTLVDLTDAGHPRAQRWSDFLEAGRTVTDEELAAAEATVTPDTVCDILFTSGTTGVPKGVMSAHRQTLGVAHVWASGAALGEADRYAIVNPFFHSFGYKAGVIAALTAGTTIHPVLTFDPVATMELIERERITVLPGAPTIFLTLINHPRLRDFDLSSLRFAIAGAASVPETLFEQMRDVLGFTEVAQAYGLTECVVATQSRPGEDPRHIAETTGPACPGLEIMAVDLEGRPVPVGTDGELWIRGDTVMLGYFEDPEATAAAIDADGWLHTGDVGRLDEHGCVKITDRIKDMFTVGGFNVYPAEVESVLSAHPDVVEAAVIGVPDERLGSVGRAYVVARDGATIDEAELTAYARERLANFKVPREIAVATQLPRNASGKVVKRDLRSEA